MAKQPLISRLPSSAKHRFEVLRFSWANARDLSEQVTTAIAKLARERQAIISVAGVASDPGELVIVCEYWIRENTNTPDQKDPAL